MRIEEYKQQSLKKEEKHVDFSKMSFEDILQHFKNHETKIGKNSGFEPQTIVDQNLIATWVYHN